MESKKPVEVKKIYSELFECILIGDIQKDGSSYPIHFVLKGGSESLKEALKKENPTSMSEDVKVGFTKLMVPRRGFEPRTQGFSVPCSTD